MTQRLANRDSADLKFLGNRILPKLFSLPQLPGENLFPQALSQGGRIAIASESVSI